MKRSYLLGALTGVGILASGVVLGPHIVHAQSMGPPSAAEDAPDGAMGYGRHKPGMGGGHGFMMHHHQPGKHIDGKLAFLKAELKIQPNQEKVWNSFESAARKASSAMQKKWQSMKEDWDQDEVTVPERLDRMESHLTARLDSLRATKAETKALYNALSADQKKTFDDLAHGPMRLM